MNGDIDITLIVFAGFFIVSFLVNFMSKGYLGEKRTALSLWFSLNKNRYSVYHNLIIPSSNGTSQIDYLIVSEFGIFDLQAFKIISIFVSSQLL